MRKRRSTKKGGEFKAFFIRLRRCRHACCRRLPLARACSYARTTNLSRMPQLLRFDIEANKLGVYPMSTTSIGSPYYAHSRMGWNFGIQAEAWWWHQI